MLKGRSQTLILYDVTRLVDRRRAAIATGIDRIDLQWAYATFMRFGAACLPIVQCGRHSAVLTRQRAAIVQLLQALRDVWFADAAPRILEKPARKLDWQGISRNTGFGSRQVARAWLANQAPASRLAMGVRGAATGLVTAARRAIAAGAVSRDPHLRDAHHILYVNASHQGLVRMPGALDRLARNGQLKAIAYIHDVMPIEWPEYTRADQITSLHTFLAELTRRNTTFVVNSHATAHSLRKAAAWSSQQTSPSVVYPGKDDRPQLQPAQTPGSNGAPNFVILGTIEPRKNHLLLLQIWRQLVAEGFQPMPHLHIIGRRGWSIENVIAMLDRCAAIRPFVSEHPQSDDAQVRSLLLSSNALLFPSFAEGFGLPLMEAAQLGVPVIASDLPVFREIIARGGRFIDPLDGLAWKDAIMQATTTPESLTPPRLAPHFGNWQAQARQFTDIIAHVL